jgi:hypothetical protein
VSLVSNGIRVLLITVLGLAVATSRLSPRATKQVSVLSVIVRSQPRWVRSHVWTGIEAVQVVIVAGLVVDRFERAAAVMGFVFFGVGVLYIRWGMKRYPGRSCGCFGSNASPTMRAVVRNVVLALGSLAVAIWPVPWGRTSSLPLLGALVVVEIVAGGWLFVERSAWRATGRGVGSLLVATLALSSKASRLRRGKSILKYVDDSPMWLALAEVFDVANRELTDQWSGQGLWTFLYRVEAVGGSTSVEIAVTADAALRSPWLRAAVLDYTESGDRPKAVQFWDSRNATPNGTELRRLASMAIGA